MALHFSPDEFDRRKGALLAAMAQARLDGLLMFQQESMYWATVTPRVKPGATYAEAMHAMAKATLEAIPERTTAAVGRLTGLAYALTSSGFARASSRDHRRQLRAWRGMAAYIRR